MINPGTASNADLDFNVIGRKSQSHWRQHAITADQLQHKVFDPISFVIPNLIPAEGVTLLCAKPKAGKSWFALDLGVAATADRFVLGEIKPPQGDVLYLALEDSERRLQRRIAKLLPTFNGAWPSRLTLVRGWRRVNEGGLDDIRQWCGSVATPMLVVVDVLEKVRPAANSNSRSVYERDYEALSGLAKLAADLSVAVLVIHHTRKMGAEDIMDTVSGSYGLSGAADTIIVIEGRSQGTVLDVRGRDVESAELAIQFSKESCRWTLLGAAAEVHRSDQRSRILFALNEASEPLSPREIMLSANLGSRNATDLLLSKMHRAGEIGRACRGKYALPGQSGQKDRTDSQSIEPIRKIGD